VTNRSHPAPPTESLTAVVPKGYVVVPVEPTDELLLSMAVRYDHGLGIPGYYDQELFASSGVSHARRLESAIGTMRQLHEEVVGTGFYRPKKQDGGIACTETLSDASAEKEPASLLERARQILRQVLCRVGFHKLVMVAERSCDWGGVDRCGHCGKEEHWSNSYR